MDEPTNNLTSIEQFRRKREDLTRIKKQDEPTIQPDRISGARILLQVSPEQASTLTGIPIADLDLMESGLLTPDITQLQSLSRRHSAFLSSGSISRWRAPGLASSIRHCTGTNNISLFLTGGTHEHRTSHLPLLRPHIRGNVCTQATPTHGEDVQAVQQALQNIQGIALVLLAILLLPGATQTLAGG